MIKLLEKRNTLGRSLVLAAILALVLSFIGNLQQNFAKAPTADRSPSENAKIVLDTIPAAIKVFRAKPRATAGSAGWVLTIAETLGALVTFSAVLALLWAVLKEQVEKFRISLMRRHTIVLGFGPQARLFLKSKQRPKESPVVVVDSTGSDKIRDKVHAENCLHYAASGEVELERQLNACAINRAQRLIITGQNDAETLEIAKSLTETDVPIPNDVIVDIQDVSLHQNLEQSEVFMGSLGTGLRLFNYPKAAAVDLLSRTNFSELAYAQQQQCVTLLLFGATPEAAEVLTHYMRSSPSLLKPRPKIVWIVQNRATLLKLLSLNYAPILELLNSKVGTAALSWCCDLIVLETSDAAAPYDQSVLTHALAQMHVGATAIIVAEDEETLAKSNIQIAQGIRYASRKTPELGAPIFLFSRRKGGEDQFLMCRDHPSEVAPVSQKKLAKTQSIENVIEPFGRSDEVCAWGTVDTARERQAQQLHAGYLVDRAHENDTDVQRAASLNPWESLPETYRNANRRAVDQMRVLKSAKNHLMLKHGEIGTAEIEVLAALEHDAWRIDRELDGWQYADQRNNHRKEHPDLIPYAQLADHIQEYDRAKVRLILE